MATLNDLQSKINQLNAEVSAIVLAIAQKIDEFPDNPNINRISESPNVFTINVKDLNRNKSLSPFDYDWRFQYRMIAEYLIDNPTQLGINQVGDILKKGWFGLSSDKGCYKASPNNYSHRVYLIDEVIKNLKSIL